MRQFMRPIGYWLYRNKGEGRRDYYEDRMLRSREDKPTLCMPTIDMHHASSTRSYGVYYVWRQEFYSAIARHIETGTGGT